MWLGGTAVPLWRRLLAGIGGLGSGIALVVWVHDHNIYKVAPAILAVLVAAFAVHVPRLGPQVFARAAWWANLGLGSMIAFTSASESDEALSYLAPSAFALLVVGRQGIAEAEERTGHVAGAFRSALLLLMVLALADAQTFTVFGLITLDADPIGYTLLLFGAAGALVIGFVGLFRLALWGAVVNAVVCAAMFVLALLGFLGGRDTIRVALLVLTGLHVLVAAPVILAAIRGAKLPSLPSRIRTILMTGGILLVVALAALRVALR